LRRFYIVSKNQTRYFPIQAQYDWAGGDASQIDVEIAFCPKELQSANFGSWEVETDAVEIPAPRLSLEPLGLRKEYNLKMVFELLLVHLDLWQLVKSAEEKRSKVATSPSKTLLLLQHDNGKSGHDDDDDDEDSAGSDEVGGNKKAASSEEAEKFKRSMVKFYGDNLSMIEFNLHTSSLPTSY
jgi:hypothetical protein